MKIVQGIPKNKIIEVLDFSYQFFRNVMDLSYFRYYILEGVNVDWNISVLLLDENENIKGVYILGNNQLSSIIFDENYIGLNGVEGVLLCNDETIRGNGFGNQLKDYPKSLGYDYIWGQQLICLNNLEYWLKRRKLIGKTENVYITAEIF